MRTFLIAAFMSAVLAASGEARTLRIGTWNIANLHHEEGVPLRNGAEPRDAEDFSRLRAFAASLNLDIVALQEIGSPRALERIFPAGDYHLVISKRYRPGDEDRPPNERDIFTAFAVKKATFPEFPKIESVDALGILHVGFDRDGTPSSRPTRDGMAMDLKIGDRNVKLLDVHLKSSCHVHSLEPVFDESQSGTDNKLRFDCRTVVAQAMILENWLEQQVQIGNSVIVLGDFNRQFNRFDGQSTRKDHFWRMINDGAPNSLTLRKGPLGKNTTCWPAPHGMFHDEHIEFVVFDGSLDPWIKEVDIVKVGMPHADDPKYAGTKGQKLSDHCPVVVEVRD
jgi:endonuclease/exonuclease/phosphatase family metal-dependent hydrolase